MESLIPIFELVALSCLILLGIDLLISRAGLFAVGVMVQFLIASVFFSISQQIWGMPASVSLLVSFLATFVSGWLTLVTPTSNPLLSAVMWILLLLVSVGFVKKFFPSGFHGVEVPLVSSTDTVLLALIGLLCGIVFHDWVIKRSFVLHSEAASWGPSWYIRNVKLGIVPRTLTYLSGTFLIWVAAIWHLGNTATLAPDEAWLIWGFEVILAYFVSRQLTNIKFLKKTWYSIRLCLFGGAFYLLNHLILDKTLYWVLPKEKWNTLDSQPLFDIDTVRAGTVGLLLGMFSIFIAIRKTTPAEEETYRWYPSKINSSDDTDRVSVKLHISELKLPYVLKDVRLNVEFLGGLIHIIEGPNGSGKTTFLSVASGWTRAKSGDVFIDGVDKNPLQLLWKGYAAAPLSNVLYIPQYTSLVPKIAPSCLAKIIDELKNEPYPNLPSTFLSGGIKRAVEISLGCMRATTHPGIRAMFADEPFAGLDQDNTRWIWGVMHSFAAKGGVVVIADHRIHLYDELPANISIQKWRLSETGLQPMSQTKTRTGVKEPYRLKAINWEIVNRNSNFTIENGKIGYESRPEIVTVKKFFARAGVICLIKGENGSGKSTVIKAISGCGPIFSGEMWFNEVSGAEVNSVNARLHKHIFLHPQDATNLIDHFYVSEMIRLFRISKIVDGKYFDCANISMNKRVCELSGGQRRWLSFVLTAHAAIGQPGTSLFLADEPIAGLWHELKPKAKEILANLMRKGCVVILTDHETEPTEFGDEIDLWELRNDEENNEIWNIQLVEQKIL